jgi:hypothetical protein
MKLMLRGPTGIAQGVKITRISQFIDVTDFNVCFRNQLSDQGRTDKSRAPSYQNAFVLHFKICLK